MVWKIIRYLAQQGYGTEKLVVLIGIMTPCSMTLIRMISSMPDLVPSAEITSKKRIRFATIDNHQDEENDIVIASLTRSNESNDIGYSRTGKELWGKFFELVKQGDCMYEGFPIRCQRHSDRTVLITSASEFDTLCPNGGCTEIW
ncbi:uncharacterized protein BJ212DRAFT_1361011 [Suillus subaureus]|uniref:DNA2/NAM7 helicase-like C-terminal domain-containing protein n=1 Tax=Suillus subaureus TaxID=48587 RepID=A0A9P7E8V5_9AGAM|nr:uncharacterized protein BJ212DRAFT_1361011 [Suillus subaureus]KAG1814631.1 hypothetical protein BJ212DRAFT_1361011 [Suillus subaureus]